MAKGYWIPQIDVSNLEDYKAYMAETPPAHEKCHGIALGARWQDGSRRRPGAPPLRAARISRPRHGARLLSFGGLSARAGFAAAAFAMRFRVAEGYDGQQPLSQSPPTARR